jgi:hypothetical protein
MSLTAGRPLNWNVLGVAAYSAELTENQLDASDHAAARGGRVVALTPSQVMTLRINLRSGFIFAAFPEWAEVIALPLPERKRALADRAVRERLDKGASSEAAGALRALAVWDNIACGGGPSARSRRSRARTPSTPCSTWPSPRTCRPPSSPSSPATTTSPGGCAPRPGATRGR